MGPIYMGNAPLLAAARPAWVCTPRALASAGASLTLAVRNGEQGEAVAADVRRGLANPHVRALAMNPSGLACVRRFATDWGGAPLRMTRLLDLKWWEWKDEEIVELLPWMLGPDIEAFVDRAEGRRRGR